MQGFYIFKIMNSIYPFPKTPGYTAMKIPAIILLLLIIQFSTSGSALHAQNDSLQIKAVPLREIANEAAHDMQQTRDILIAEVQVSTSSDLLPQIDSLEIRIADLDELTKKTLDSRFDYSYYSSLELRWERQNERTGPLQTSLQKYLADLDEISAGMEHNLAKWELTLEATDPTALTEDIVSRIDGISLYLDSARLILNDSLNSSLALLNRLADLDLIIKTNLHDLSELMKTELGTSILSREESIFAIQKSSDSLNIKGDRIFLLTMGIQDTKVYLENEWPTLLLLLFALMGWLFAMLFLKKNQTPPGPDADQEDIFKERILKFPVATAFVFTMLLALWWLPPRPVFLKEIFVILFIIPFLPIVRSLAFKGIHLSLYYLSAILLFNILNDYLPIGDVYLRLSSLLESLALFSFHIYFLIAKRRIPRDEIKGHFFYQLLNAIQPFYFILTFLAVLANFIGYWNYAEMVNEAVLMSLILLLLFPTGFFSLMTVLQYFFKTKVADKSLVLKENKDQVYRWLFRNLRFGTAILWIYYTMRLFYLWDPFIRGMNKVLDIGYAFGELNVSIRDILSFVLVVYLSWLVSFLIRNLLEIELFGRLKLPRGVPRAVSSLTQYFLITVGIFAGPVNCGL